MPSKRGTATKGKIVGRERKFEADRRRLDEKRRRRAEVEREGRREAAGDAPAGDGDRGR